VDNVDERVLRKIYSEIIAGYSISVYDSRIVYIKHPSKITLLEFDFRYQQKYAQLIADGIPSEKEKVHFLIRDKLWNPKNETRIAELRTAIEQLYTAKRNHYSPREITSYNEQIKVQQGFLLELLAERIRLIGNCAESMARRLIDTEEIVASFYKDTGLQEKMFKSVDDIADEDLEKIFSIYEQFSKNTSDSSLRKVAVSQEFLSLYSLTDNLYYFYGKAISQLTNYQAKLAQYGGYYKTILFSDPKPPEEIRGDPEALEDWFFARTNIQKAMDKDEAEGKATSFFGMNRKELEFLGVEIDSGSSKQMDKLADENGEISYMDLKKHGYI
jgi:hypothetical protein